MTTRKIPFEIVYGIHPRGVYDLRELKDQGRVSVHAYDFAKSMKEIHEQVKETLIEANQRLKSKMDMKRRDLQFEIGDLVMS